LRIHAMQRLWQSNIISQACLYTLIGSVIFLLPVVNYESHSKIMALCSIILFLMGSLVEVVSAVPVLSTAEISLENIEDLEASLHFDPTVLPAAEAVAFAQTAKNFREIQLKQVTFHYADQHGRGLFTLGPAELTIHAGEVLFIVGGNGSGKSTLIRLLCGLYKPASGEIWLDNSKVDVGSYERYRNYFSVIFSDFHLFNRLYGIENIERERIDNLIKTMELEDQTQFVDGRFTNIKLSTGQKKRIAMIGLCLEDRPIYVFDEWAADQDPSFRKYFYETMLQDFRKMGKTVIAVTHDDRYFGAADRVVKMEYGRFIPMDTSKNSIYLR